MIWNVFEIENFQQQQQKYKNERKIIIHLPNEYRNPMQIPNWLPMFTHKSNNLDTFKTKIINV